MATCTNASQKTLQEIQLQIKDWDLYLGSLGNKIEHNLLDNTQCLQDKQTLNRISTDLQLVQIDLNQRAQLVTLKGDKNEANEIKKLQDSIEKVMGAFKRVTAFYTSDFTSESKPEGAKSTTSTAKQEITFQSTPPDSLLILPQDVLRMIFKLLTFRRDYRGLSLACKRLRALSLEKELFQKLELPPIPSFLKLAASTRKEKLELIATIETNLLKSDSLKSVYSRIHQGEKPIVKAFINNHVIIQDLSEPASINVYVYALENTTSRLIKNVHLKPLSSITPVDVSSTPLIVFAYEGGFSIWDFNKLFNDVHPKKTAELLCIATCIPKPSWLYEAEYKDLMVKVSHHHLVIGDPNDGFIYIIDCSKKIVSGNVIKVKVGAFQEIAISDEQIFIVDSKKITVMDIKTCSNRFVKECEHPIKFIKVLEREVLVAYKKCQPSTKDKKSTGGELFKKENGELIRKLSHPYDPQYQCNPDAMYAVDALDHKIVGACCRSLVVWDMDTNEDVVLDVASFDKNLNVKKIHCLGKHILCTVSAGIMFFDRAKLSSPLAYRNVSMHLTTKEAKKAEDMLISSEFYESYLVVEIVSQQHQIIKVHQLTASKKTRQ